MSRAMRLTMVFLICSCGVVWADGTFPDKTLILGADAPEKRFYDVGNIGPACVGQTDWKKDGQLISLADAGDAVEFYLATIPKGMYMIAIRCRTGHQLTGWEYCMPDVRYTVSIDDKNVPMERSKADPILITKGEGWTDYAGWIVSRDFVELRPGNRVKMMTGESFAYMTKIAFLTPAQAMACDWLVPDVLGKSLDKAKDVRARLVELDRKSEQFQKTLTVEPEKMVSLSAAMGAMDRGMADYNVRLEKLREAFREAQEKNDELTMKSLQDQRVALMAVANEPLLWAKNETQVWCKNITVTLSDLPALPETGDYHARWAAILRGWIEMYKKDLATTPKEETGQSIARRLARAVRLLDLAVRYRKEVSLAKAVSLPKTLSVAEPVLAKKVSVHEPASVCLNGVWDFQAGNDPATMPTSWETIRVPHGPWQEVYGRFINIEKKWNPEHHVGWYRTKIFVPADWDARNVSVRFEAVFYYTEVYLNGVYCGNHLGGFERFSIDLAKAVRPGMMNELLVMVKDSRDTASDLETQPMHHVVVPNYLAVNDLWNVNFGGIWQDVFLEVHPDRAQIADVAISTPVKGGVRLNLKAAAKNDSDQTRTLVCRFTVLDKTTAIETLESQPQKVQAGKSVEWTMGKAMANVKLWGIGGRYGEPYLYRLKTELLEKGNVIDVRYDPFGFSQLWIEGDKFVFNGKPLFLAGGGIWYLQEDKFPLANRFFASQLFRMDRGANIAIERIHRHGDMAVSYYQEASEMGMLLEPEANPGPCWILDAVGSPDLDDPIVRTNVRNYYRGWAAKHRNFPCIGLTSIENENFLYTSDEELMGTFLEMARTVQEEDPLRVFSLHGNHQMADHPGVPYLNLHYCHGASVSAWKKPAKGRPVINGEHNSGSTPLVNNQDRQTAARAEDGLANFWKEAIRWYRKDAAGLFVFMPALQAYCTTSDWKKTTPWGDQFKDLTKFSPGDDRWTCNFWANIPVPWPSLSGPDAKVEQMTLGAGRCTFNWFDPSRPVCTPNKVYDAIKESFPKLEPCVIQRCQEALITVTADGKRVSAAMVVLTPMDGQPVASLGAVTDSSGTAWIVPRIPGKYRISVWSLDGSKKESTMTLDRYSADKAGYEQNLVRVTVEIQRISHQ